MIFGLTAHQEIDVLYWLAFAGGQLLFMLKRADLAVRSPLNAVATKRQFFRKNWVVLLIRSFFEFAAVFMPYRHADTDAIARSFGWTMPFHIPQSWVVSALFGYFSDSIVDWITMQEKIMGIPIPKFVKENIPQLTIVTNVVALIRQKNEKEQGYRDDA